MNKFKIGVIAESFKTDIITAIKNAKELGAHGIQINAKRIGIDSESSTSKNKTEILDIIYSEGLEICALGGYLSPQWFINKKKRNTSVEEAKRVLYMAKELSTDIVTTHLGVIPENKNHDRYKIFQDSCYDISNYASSIDAYYAIETGPDKAIVLKEFLDSVNSKGIAVNFDPANLVMVVGDDPINAVYILKDYIVHTHAKDGIKLQDKSPEEIYEKIEEEVKLQEAFKETPLGEGNVDFEKYLKALEDIGYKAYLTIEREVGVTPQKDIATAFKFLNSINNIT